MYTGYANEISEEDLLYEPSERTSDIQLPSVVNILLLGGWLVICLVGFAIIFFTKNIVLGITVIGIPTFFGMVIKPTFALCVMMLVLPTGAGVGTDVFSLDRGVGIAVAVSFLLNLMISRPTLRIRNKSLWFLVGYAIWAFLISLTSPSLRMDLVNAFTVVQLTALTFIVYSILETNNESTFRWILRSYVFGSLCVIAITHITGAAMQTMEEPTGRYRATLGHEVDANLMSVLIGLSFLSAIYLLASDKNLFFRIIYFIAIVALPMMMIKTGSRGGLIALGFTLLSPLLFLRQVLRKPILAVFLLMIIIIGLAAMALLVTRTTLTSSLESHLTDVGSIQRSFDYRIELISTAAKSVLERPLGTTLFRWLTYHKHIPHNDFFYVLAIFGIPGAGFFLLFLIAVVLAVRRIPLGIEKLYARAIVTFLVVAGLGLEQVKTKHYWIFMVVAITSERIAWLKNRSSEQHIESLINEETACISY